MRKEFDYSHHEDEYFLKQDAKLRERLRQLASERAKLLESEPKLAGDASPSDADILARLRELGVTDEQFAVLHLVPLVEVAWADGRVQARERHAILEAATRHGAGPGSAGSAYLAALLEHRPDPEVFDHVRDVTAALLKARGLEPQTLTDLAYHVADAAGGFLGLGSRIDAQERKLLDRLEADLGPLPSI